MLENKDGLAKIGFNIGWDFYANSMQLPETALGQASVVQGFKEAESRKISTHKSDRYERKILTLRLNAFVRGKAFDEKVDVFFLKAIDVTHCPVTLMELTHGTLSESDWSVDRIHNDAGYVAGNLVVVSTKANKAKGSMHYDDITNMIADMDENPNIVSELNIFEWIRWFTICSRCIPVPILKDHNFSEEKSAEYNRNCGDGEKLPDHIPVEERFSYSIAPFVVLNSRSTIPNPSDTIQMLITAMAMKKNGSPQMIKAYKSLITRLPPDLVAFIEKIKKQATRVFEKQLSRDPLDIWFNRSLFNNIALIFKYDGEFHNVLIRELRSVRREFLDPVDFSKIENIDEAALNMSDWHLDTGGRIK